MKEPEEIQDYKCEEQGQPADIITPECIESLEGCSIEQACLKLSDIYGFTQFDVCLKEGALLDCYVSAYWFGLENNFPPPTNCFLLNLLHELLEGCRKDKSMSEGIRNLKHYFSPSLNSQLKQEHGKMIAEYIMESLFQHYKLYQYLFHQKQQQVMLKQQVLVESVFPQNEFNPPPLEEGIPEWMYVKYVAAPNEVEQECGTEDVKAEADIQVGQQQPLCDECSSAPTMQDPNERTKEQKLVDILKGMTAEQITDIVETLAQEKLSPLKVDLETKLQEREAALIAKMEKLQSK